MNRHERQGAIRRIVREGAVSTQSELADALHAAGHDVVQTTVSRDIRELGLVKVRDAAGRLGASGRAPSAGVDSSAAEATSASARSGRITTSPASSRGRWRACAARPSPPTSRR